MNVIFPSFVPTETVKEAQSMTDEGFSGFEDQLGLSAGRLGTPTGIGALTRYLAAPASEQVTGQGHSWPSNPEGEHHVDQLPSSPE